MKLKTIRNFMIANFLFALLVTLSSCQFGKSVWGAVVKDCSVQYNCNGLAKDLWDIAIKKIPQNQITNYLPVQKLGYSRQDNSQAKYILANEKIRQDFPKQYWEAAKIVSKRK